MHKQLHYKWQWYTTLVQIHSLCFSNHVCGNELTLSGTESPFFKALSAADFKYQAYTSLLIIDESSRQVNCRIKDTNAFLYEIPLNISADVELGRKLKKHE